MLEFNDIIIWQQRSPPDEKVRYRLQSEAGRRDGKASAAAEVSDLLRDVKQELSSQEQFLMQDV